MRWFSSWRCGRRLTADRRGERYVDVRVLRFTDDSYRFSARAPLRSFEVRIVWVARVIPPFPQSVGVPFGCAPVAVS